MCEKVCSVYILFITPFFDHLVLDFKFWFKILFYSCLFFNLKKNVGKQKKKKNSLVGHILATKNVNLGVSRS